MGDRSCTQTLTGGYANLERNLALALRGCFLYIDKQFLILRFCCKYKDLRAILWAFRPKSLKRKAAARIERPTSSASRKQRGTVVQIVTYQSRGVVTGEGDK